MVRKRVAGRFVRDEPEGAKEQAGDGTGAEAGSGASVTVVRVAAPRPKYCRTYTRKRVAEALPEIVETFLKAAKEGSVPHAKALANLGGLDKGDVVPKVKQQRGKSLAGRLLEQLRTVPPK